MLHGKTFCGPRVGEPTKAGGCETSHSWSSALVPVTRGGLGVLHELLVAVMGSVPVPVTVSRYGHPVPVTANTLVFLCPQNRCCHMVQVQFLRPL